LSKVNVVSAEVTPRLRLNLITSQDVAAGETIFRCSPYEVVPARTWRTVQIDFDRHLKNEFLDYVDHSCEPNAILDVPSLSFVALRDIPAERSVTFFYPGAEVELAQAFTCNCGSPHCLRHVRGGFYLTHAQMRWAIDSGYCTTFMRPHFERLLGWTERPAG
jgi:hypothetical protein